MKKEICSTLAEIEKLHNVKILYACESGSRAWGFPSPDSDYDARYLYIRPLESYLKLFPERDVIEGPIDEVKDFVGWDLQKALKPLMKGNAPLIEWLHSPIVYKDNLWLRENLIRLFNNNSNFNALYRGYFGLAMNNFKAYPHRRKCKAQKISLCSSINLGMRMDQTEKLHSSGFVPRAL